MTISMAAIILRFKSSGNAIFGGVGYGEAMSDPVAVFSSRLEAELARARLEVEGIPSYLLTDDAGGWEPQLDIRGVRLMVAEQDRAPALEVLDLPEQAIGASAPNLDSDRWYRISAWVIGAIIVFGAIQTLRAIF